MCGVKGWRAQGKSFPDIGNVIFRDHGLEWSRLAACDGKIRECEAGGGESRQEYVCPLVSVTNLQLCETK